MVKKCYPLFVLLLCIQQLLAQDNSIGIFLADSSLHKKTLIIPFEPDMYRSDMDREIGKYNGLSQIQIVEKLRVNFDRSLENIVQLKNETHSFLHDETTADESNLINLYSSIGFVYTPIVRSSSKKEKIINNIIPPKNKDLKDSRIKNGEVYTKSDTLERYMKTIVKDATVLEKIAEQSGVQNFLFINQFELRNYFHDPIELQNDTYQRELKIHYSILNKEGKELAGGLAKCVFSNKVININEIISSSFVCAAKQISDALNQYELSLITPKK